MHKPTQQELDYWEAILESEGLAEISLFDNTGKSKGLRFISTTCDGHNNSRDVGKTFGDDNVEWFEALSIKENGRQVRFEDTPEAIYARKLSKDVASLPLSWPENELKLLQRWADTGNQLESCKQLGIDWWKEGRRIIRRFEQFIKDSLQ